MNESLVSVIVPIYNAEKYLNQCVKSIIQQDYDNFELILINDGSTDGSRQIAEKYVSADERVTLINTENFGVCHARNVGLDMARGEYVMFVDSDDSLPNNSISALYNILKQSDADIAIGKKCGTIPPKTKEMEKATICIWQNNEPIEKFIADDPDTYGCHGKLYCFSAIKNVRFMEGRKIHEDNDFILRVFLNKPKVVICDIYTYIYNASNTESASRGAFSERYFDIIKFAQEHKRLIDESYPAYSDVANNITLKANMSMLHCLCKANGLRYFKEITRCIRVIRKNKDYFIPALPSDTKWLWIITHHLYWPYKFYFRLRKILC